MSTVIQSRRNRQTGTTIDVIDRGTVDGVAVAEYREDPYRWETICVEHGTVCSHETRALALYMAPSPLDWCEDCADAREQSA